MTLLLILSLRLLQSCYGQELPQQQVVPNLQQPQVQQQVLPAQQQSQQPLLPAQPISPLQTPQTTLFGAQNGQPGSLVDLFRGAAASLSQTLINLLNYKVQWLNRLASSIPPVQNSNLQQNVQQSGSPLLGSLTPAVSPMLPSLLASVPAPGAVGSGTPITGTQGPTQQALPPTVPVQPTQPVAANPIAQAQQTTSPVAQPAPLTQQPGVAPSPPQQAAPEQDTQLPTEANPLSGRL